jgi:hypothetical protein
MLPRPEQRLVTSLFLGTVLSVASVKIIVLGIAKTAAPHGAFHQEISRIAATYDGPLAVVVARGPHVDLRGPLNIVVPVRENTASQRAAEVALALAKSSDSPMTAL